MSRNIPNRPHPTPDPEKPHGAARTDWSSLARSIQGLPSTSEPLEKQLVDGDADEPTYDSCFDDLNLVLTQSIQQPDPDPNLESGAERSRPQDGNDPETGRSTSDRSKPPRTSEIFRSVMSPGGIPSTPAGSSPTSGGQDAEAVEMVVTDLGVIERREGVEDAGTSGEHAPDGHIPWGQILLLSYASILTLALTWLLWTGRIPRPAAQAPPAAVPKAVAEPPFRLGPGAPDESPPPLPPENIARLGKPLRLGDLEVTPMAVEAGTVDLIHTIDSEARRREKECLILRLRLRNLSREQSFSPLDRILVRDRDLRSFDPYIATSDGRSLRLFPLALDSEWSIQGQEFSVLAPGESVETFVAAEPGSAKDLPEEMTWRLRLRIGVYRSDMLGVKFTRAEVRHRGAGGGEEE